MRIIFMGSAELACPSLAALLQSTDDTVVGVITQPDRPKGRNLVMSPCATKTLVEGRGLPILTPAKVNAPESLAAIADLRPEIIVVVAYGQILRPELLALPPRGCINVHASLLPKYRGAAPIQWAIANGDAVTGVTVMHVNERMDAGDIILKRPEPIRPDDTSGALHDRLARLGAAALLDALDALRNGTAARIPQIEAESTRAPKLSKTDGHIDWSRPAREIRNRIRAFNPWPCCYVNVPAGETATAPLRILTAVEEVATGAPGTVLDTSGDGPLVAAGENALRLLVVQPEGRRPMSGAAYLNGHPLPAGTVLT